MLRLVRSPGGLDPAPTGGPAWAGATAPQQGHGAVSGEVVLHGTGSAGLDQPTPVGLDLWPLELRDLVDSGDRA